MRMTILRDSTRTIKQVLRQHRLFVLWLGVSFLLIGSLAVIHVQQPSSSLTPNQSSRIPDFLDLTHIPTFWGKLSNIDERVALNITQDNSTIISSPYVHGMRINESTLWYTSHFVDGRPVRIFARLFYPALTRSHDGTGILPGVVMVHGLRSDSSALVEKAVKLASFNYTVLALDLPGHGGRSTGIPPFSAETSLNVTPTPRNSHFYHAAVSVYRAITVLTTLDVVNSSNIGLVGGSFGGIMTFIVAALDSRVKVALPLLESGNFLDAFQRKMYTARLVPQGTDFNDPIVRTFLQSFDPLVYAAHLKVPTLMIIGTHDPVTTLEDFNLTYSVIPGSVEKNLLLLPAARHEMFEEIDNTTLYWLEHVFRGAPSLPRVTARIESSHWTWEGETRSLSVVIEGLSQEHQVTTVELGFREGIMGFGWKSIDLSSSLFTISQDGTMMSGTVSITGYVVPVEEDLVIVARLSSGAVVSSPLLKTRLFHVATIPLTFTISAVFMFLAVHFVRTEGRELRNFWIRWRRRHDASLLEFIVEDEQILGFVVHRVVGGIILGLYIASICFLPWLAFPRSWVSWTILEFLDVFVHQDLIVYGLFLLMIGSFTFWVLKKAVITGSFMFMPPLALSVAVIIGRIPNDFIIAIGLPLSYACAIGMVLMPVLERMLRLMLKRQKRLQDDQNGISV